MKWLPSFFNKKHKILGGFKFKNDTVYCFFTDQKKYGASILNDQGDYEVIVPPVYNSTGYDAQIDGILAFQYPSGNYTINQNNAHIFDLKGTLLATFEKIDTITRFRSVLLIQKKGKKGVLNDSLQMTVPCEYQELVPISNTIFNAKKYDLNEDSKEINHSFNGIINIEHQVLGSFGFTKDIFHYIYQDTLIVGIKSCYIGIEPSFDAYHIPTQSSTKLSFDDILDGHHYNHHFDAQAIYRTNVFDPNQKDEILDFIEDDGARHIVGKWGAILPDGTEIIPNQYDFIKRISSQYFKVAMGSPKITWDNEERNGVLTGFKWGLVDLHHNQILEIRYDWIDVDEQSNEIFANIGGKIIWYDDYHRPEWIVEGGTYEPFDQLAIKQ